MLKLIALIVPLGLDTFVVSTAVGAIGLPARHRLRIALVFTLFEGAMPLVGLGLGASLSSAIGSTAEYLAIALLVGLGLYVLLFEDEQGETERIGRLTGAFGWGTVLLGLSISLDELAIGFSLGLLHLPTVPALIFIAAQAFLVAQLGLRLGTRASETVRDGAEKLVGLGLIGVGLFLLAEKLLA
jgi:putative Mn2+ efflux pump MntP